LLSRLIFQKWSRPFTWDIGREQGFLFVSNKLEGQGTEFVLHCGTWDEHWVIENEQFEKVLWEDPNLVCFSNNIFLRGIEPSHLGLDAIH